MVQLKIEQTAAIFGLVVKGIPGTRIDVVQALVQQAVADQVAAPVGVAQCPGRIAHVATQLEKHVAQMAWRALAPAVFVKPGARHIPVPAVGPTSTVAELDAFAPKAANGGIDFRARMCQTGLSAQHQGAAQRVQAIERVGTRDQGHICNGHFRDQIPVHHIAQRLVHAHAIDVNRETLGRA